MTPEANVRLFDPEASSVTAVISNLVDAGMCDVLSPLLGGPHLLTSDSTEDPQQQQ